MFEQKKHVLRALAGSAALALTLAGLAACAGSGESGGKTDSGKKLDHVTVQLDYQVRGNHAMFYVAKEKGYFEKEGIAVDKILTGDGSPNTLRLVGQGQGDFGFADLPSLVVARTQGVDVTALAAINQTSPMAMCAKKDRHELKKPEDLEGLTVGVQHSGSTYIFFKALLAANDMSLDDVTELSVKPPYESYLLTDKVDTVICYVDAEVPTLEAHAGGPGSLSIMLGSKFGYDAYGSGVFTSDAMIKKDPDLVQRFMNAYAKAFDYVDAHPEEAAKILAASNPKLADQEKVFAQQLEADVKSTFTSPLTDEKGLGAMSEETWQKTEELLADQDIIKSTPKVSELYDNTFIEKANSSK